MSNSEFTNSGKKTPAGSGDKEPLALGKLWVDSLPRGAWEEWRKDGGEVVCFSFSSPQLLKIYFADPKTLSVYHVVDFVYAKFGRDWDLNMFKLGCTLVGSTIYVLGGTGCDVYYCDVANMTSDHGYEWKRGPNLNALKYRPLVFSLANSIYVLSIDRKSWGAPFEVLKARKKKPGHRKKWKLLNKVPEILTQNGTRVLGSFVYEDGKQFLLLVYHGWEQILITYDAKSDSWGDYKKVEYCYSFGLPVNDFDLFLGKSFAINGVGYADESAILGALGLKKVESLFIPSSEQIEEYRISRACYYLSCGEEEGPYPDSWHILPLRGNKFCVLALYAECHMLTCYVRFGTFDLVGSSKQCCASKPPKLKKQRSASKPTKVKIKNWKYKDTRIADEQEMCLLPYTMVCTLQSSSVHS